MRNFMRFIIVLIISFFEILSSATAQQSGKAVKLEVDLREEARRIYTRRWSFRRSRGHFAGLSEMDSRRACAKWAIVDVTGVKFLRTGKSELAAKHGGFVCVECEVSGGCRNA